MQYMQHMLPDQVAEKVLSRQATGGQVPAQAQLTSRQAVSTTDMVSTMQISETAIQESRDKRDAETLSKEFEIKEEEWNTRLLEHKSTQYHLEQENSKLKQAPRPPRKPFVMKRQRSPKPREMISSLRFRS